MTDDEFDQFVADANEELQLKQTALTRKLGLGRMGRWWFDQATGKLQLFDKADRLAIEADVVCIGSYSPESCTWKWSWANESVLPRLRRQAEQVRVLADLTGLAVFDRAEPFESDEEMAWELTAMAVKQLRALGCYRAPSEQGLLTFLAITKYKLFPE